jgi:hypothetical protein
MPIDIANLGVQQLALKSGQCCTNEYCQYCGVAPSQCEPLASGQCHWLLFQDCEFRARWRRTTVVRYYQDVPYAELLATNDLAVIVQQITGPSVQPNGGQTISNALTGLNPAVRRVATYHSANSKWYFG